jgi:hypothetical protein
MPHPAFRNGASERHNSILHCDCNLARVYVPGAPQPLRNVFFDALIGACVPLRSSGVQPGYQARPFFAPRPFVLSIGFFAATLSAVEAPYIARLVILNPAVLILSIHSSAIAARGVLLRSVAVSTLTDATFIEASLSGPHLVRPVPRSTVPSSHAAGALRALTGVRGVTPWAAGVTGTGTATVMLFAVALRSLAVWVLCIIALGILVPVIHRRLQSAYAET